MKLYLVRHGETEHNRLGIYSNTDEDLNNTGIKQAQELREKIKGIEYDVCYCSPLKRAKHTAKIINYLDRILVPLDYLIERDPKILNGKPLNTTDREEYWNYYSSINYGAETMHELFKRVNNFIEELKYSRHKSVLIVAHSGVSKAFYAYFNGVPKDGHFLNLGLKNCEIKEYTLE